MSEDGVAHQDMRPARLHASKDARVLVRLIQCPQCSLPFRSPVTLPCGRSLCRACLPQPHQRENISYPNTPDRQQGVSCPFEECGKEHPERDCSVDVCLSKIMEIIHVVVESCGPIPENTPGKLWQIGPGTASTGRDTPNEQLSEHVLFGGRLLSTFGLTVMGHLDYHAEVGFESLSASGDDYHSMDAAMLSRLSETTHKELDCHVCYNMMYDPVTTPCGHTFCRKCLARVLDHSRYCPMCRRTLPIPPSLEQQPSNARLVSLLQGLCPDLVISRAEAVAAEEQVEMGELDTRLFVCTLAFPSMPTFLHIFEPRYRLMIRRSMESNRQFGMLTYNQHGVAQSDLGVTTFKEYGTMLRILNVHMLPDGRSLVETRGLYRFRVRAHSTLDGYTVGRVDRVEDVSLAEEERLEAEDITSSIPLVDSPMDGRPTRTRRDTISQLSTQQLLLKGLEFVQKMRAHSAPWLHQRIIEVNGGPPNDPALFPYWFATIIPIVDEEKYQLLHTETVRERLKIVVGWIQRIETQRW
jgi:Lon protease-like protein